VPVNWWVLLDPANSINSDGRLCDSADPSVPGRLERIDANLSSHHQSACQEDAIWFVSVRHTKLVGTCQTVRSNHGPHGVPYYLPVPGQLCALTPDRHWAFHRGLTCMRHNMAVTTDSRALGSELVKVSCQKTARNLETEMMCQVPARGLRDW